MLAVTAKGLFPISALHDEFREREISPTPRKPGLPLRRREAPVASKHRQRSRDESLPLRRREAPVASKHRQRSRDESPSPSSRQASPRSNVPAENSCRSSPRAARKAAARSPIQSRRDRGNATNGRTRQRPDTTCRTFSPTPSTATLLRGGGGRTTTAVATANETPVDVKVASSNAPRPSTRRSQDLVAPESPEAIEARLIDRQKELIREIEADIWSLKFGRPPGEVPVPAPVVPVESSDDVSSRIDSLIASVEGLASAAGVNMDSSPPAPPLQAMVVANEQITAPVSTASVATVATVPAKTLVEVGEHSCEALSDNPLQPFRMPMGFQPAVRNASPQPRGYPQRTSSPSPTIVTPAPPSLKVGTSHPQTRDGVAVQIAARSAPMVVQRTPVRNSGSFRTEAPATWTSTNVPVVAHPSDMPVPWLAGGQKAGVPFVAHPQRQPIVTARV